MSQTNWNKPGLFDKLVLWNRPWDGKSTEKTYSSKSTITSKKKYEYSKCTCPKNYLSKSKGVAYFKLLMNIQRG